MGARRRDALGDEDALRGGLVHRDGGSEHARARVGDAEHVERALDQAVFTEFAMQRIEDDSRVLLADFFGERLGMEFHRDGVVVLGFQGVQDGRAGLAGNGRFGGRAAHDDDNFIVFHERKFSYLLFISSASRRVLRSSCRCRRRPSS